MRDGTLRRTRNRSLQAAILARFVSMVLIFLAPNVVAASATVKPPSTLPRGVYVGTIGSRSVVGEFGSSPYVYPPVDVHKAVVGQYFYRRYGLGIILIGARNADGSLTLNELKAAYPRPKPSGDVWHVRVAGDHVRGTWSSRSARIVNDIDLVRIGSDDPDGPGYENAALYDKELVRDTPMRGEERVVDARLAYAGLTDPRFGISGLEITRLGNETVRLAANATLARDFNRYRIEASDCLTHGLYFLGGEFKQSARVVTFSINALSLDERSQFYCGGGHPDESFEPLTIDLRTGAPIDWKKAIADRGAVAELYVQRAPLAIPGDESFRRSCVPVYASLGANHIKDDLEFEFVPGGLLVRVDFPHVVASCEADVVFPSTEVREFFASHYRALLP